MDAADSLAAAPCRLTPAGWLTAAYAAAPIGIPGGEERTRRRRDLEHLDQLVELLESSPNLAFTVQTDGRVVWANRAAMSWIGLRTHDELEEDEREVGELIRSPHRHGLPAEAYAALWAEGVWVGEIDLALPDGMPIPMALSVTSHYGSDGYPDYYSVIARDISASRAAAAELAASQARLHTLVTAAPIGIFETDTKGWCTFVNPAFCEITGVDDPADALGLGWGRMVHPDDATDAGAAWARAVHHDEAFHAQLRFVRTDARIAWVEIEAIPVHDEAGRTTMFLGTVDDVTERLRLERARIESAELFRSAFDNAPTGMILADATTREPVLVECNPTFADLVGLRREELTGRDLSDFIHPDDLRSIIDGRVALIAGDADRDRLEFRLQPPAGGSIWCATSRSVVRDADGKPRYVLSQVADITAERAAKELVERYAFTDPLTGIANRRALTAQLDVDRSRELALLFLDLDNFKRINDELGHDAGDELLVEVASVLVEHVRAGDVVARLGGDEFAVALRDASPALVRQIGERLTRALRFERPLPDGTLVVVTASVGVARSVPGDTADELLRRADGAMYRSKRRGKGVLTDA